jgi:hypothetical protein
MGSLHDYVDENEKRQQQGAIRDAYKGWKEETA